MRRRPRQGPALVAVVLLALTAACTATPASGPAPESAVPRGLTTVAVTVPAGLDADPLDTDRRLSAPPRWTVSVWARADAARLLAWSPDGRLLVSRPKHGDVLAFVPGSAAPTEQTLLTGLNQPHGLAFAGGRLYVAESDQVTSHAYAAGRLTDRRVVVDGLPDAESADLQGAYAHALKSVAVGPDGAVYVSVGSTGNVSVEDRSADPERATILRVAPGTTEPTVFARGVRNGTGLALDPDGAVWTAVNNRDNVGFPHDRDVTGDGRSDRGDVVPDYVDDHPLEPLAKLTVGRDLGWPHCNPDPDVDPGTPDSPLVYADRPFVRDVETNADGSQLDCGSLAPVEQGLGAHSAPLGLSFTSSPGLPQPYGVGALVGVHGSWNRQPPRAPEVAFFPWQDGRLGDQQTLLGGFQDADGDRWGKPVMAVQGPDGAVYVSDDVAGAVYRLTPPG